MAFATLVAASINSSLGMGDAYGYFGSSIVAGDPMCINTCGISFFFCSAILANKFIEVSPFSVELELGYRVF